MSDDYVDLTRRDLLIGTSTLAMAGGTLAPGGAFAETKDYEVDRASVELEVNGLSHRLHIDPRATVLDTLREHIGLNGAKKGCDHGQCGACTIHIDGRRVLSCLSLAVAAQGKKITTIEGLGASDNALHPMQQAFLDHDGFQCGYCTPGQIMSAIACVQEGHASSPDEIREYMSGNLCRCGAYVGIIAAIQSIVGQGG